MGCKGEWTLLKAKHLLLFLLCWALSGCGSNHKNQEIEFKPQAPQKKQTNSKPKPFQNQFYISPGDVLEVQFPYKPELNSEYQVRTDGKISLPFLGSVLAAGKSPTKFQNEIATWFNNLAIKNSQIKSENKQYRIQAGDELEIKFFYNSDLDELVTVRPDGKISLPFIHSVVAERKTPERLTSELQKKFMAYMKKPDLVVVVRKFSSERFYIGNKLLRTAQYRDLDQPMVVMRKTRPLHIYIGGEVNRPGVIPYNGPISAIQAIIMAGGGKLSGEMEQVAVIRKRFGQRAQLIVRNLQTETVSSDAENNQVLTAALGDIELEANDILIIPKTSITKFNDFLGQYIYDVIPMLKNSSLGLIYELNPVREIRTTTVP